MNGDRHGPSRGFVWREDLIAETRKRRFVLPLEAEPFPLGAPLLQFLVELRLNLLRDAARQDVACPEGQGTERTVIDELV